MIRLLVFLVIAAVMVSLRWYWPLACYVCFILGGFGGEQVGRSDAARERA